jgi:hypothetical protein
MHVSLGWVLVGVTVEHAHAVEGVCVMCMHACVNRGMCMPVSLGGGIDSMQVHPLVLQDVLAILHGQTTSSPCIIIFLAGASRRKVNTAHADKVADVVLTPVLRVISYIGIDPNTDDTCGDPLWVLNDIWHQPGRDRRCRGCFCCVAAAIAALVPPQALAIFA